MAAVVDVAGLGALLDTLAGRGFTLIGPTLRDGVVVLAPISGVDDLPRGVRDEQSPGRYRAERTAESRLFDQAATVSTWKAYLFPSQRTLWRAADDGEPTAEPLDRVPRALIGVRSCDLRALAVLDTVLTGRQYADPDYAERRSRTFVVAVTCAVPGGTCFCVSMGSGPRPDSGYDVALTEILDDEGHRFVAEAGTDAGASLLADLPSRIAAEEDLAASEAVAARAAASMGRAVDTTDIRDLIYASADDPHWDDVASRCLSCGNCTMVCPTCFCVTTVEPTGLAESVSRDRVWDSCFTSGHSLMHGQPVRASTASRYRQWLTHKFASWQDQFGTSGCVGCGRCVTWCPVGIDVTQELAALRRASGEDG
ncbi:MAG TPA: 4Fe-4S dicluster domain-containing protein [Actinomycetes bacterium]|nr:4Fe-4S dicluster domain-containing protein [Actinomycetes bacterium]